MSHNYHYDYGVLKQLSQVPQVHYIGLLGPRKKADLILANLKEEGIETASLTERLFAPVGLNIGAEAADEIAVAVMAELLAVYHGHGAGFLRDLNGPIHNRSMLYPQSQYDV
jgi:xanthine/CO dehydrogenase XdhC/CoxF family maturation factor